MTTDFTAGEQEIFDRSAPRVQKFIKLIWPHTVDLDDWTHARAKIAGAREYLDIGSDENVDLDDWYNLVCIRVNRAIYRPCTSN